MHLKSLIIKYY